MLGYLRKLIRENRSLRRQNANMAGLLEETSHALTRAVRRNVALGEELKRSTETIRDLMH